MRRALATFLVGIAACTPAHTARPVFPDAPLELRDDSDRDQATDQLWVLPHGAHRDTIRNEVASALARRIIEAIDDDDQVGAQELVFQLASLWRDDPDGVRIGLSPHAALVHRVRAVFAKSGAIEPTVLALALLAELEPDHRTEHVAELDEALAFADELARYEHGDIATNAQPAVLLQPPALALPLPWLVDRYLAALDARHAVVAKWLVDHGAPTLELLSAQPDFMHSAHRIANVLARAGRADEIHAHLAKLTGPFAGDHELTNAAADVAASHKSAAYFELARVLRDSKTSGDPAAALGVALTGIARYPHDTSLYASAAEDATTLGRVDQPIALYEAAIDNDRELDATTALRLGKLYAERIARFANGGRPGAAATAWDALARYTASEARRAPNDIWRQVAALGESSLGRGLVSQGQLADGEHALVASLERAPSVEAYEALATIAIKTDRLKLAHQYAVDGLGMLGGSTSGDRYHRAKLGRLAGDAERAGGHARDAASLYLESLRAWASLGEDKRLPRSIAAERKLELGRVEWFLGNSDEAVEVVQQAVDIDPDSANTCMAALAFLIAIGRTSEAQDTLHRTLGSNDISELYKVYASLWALADARWRGRPVDRLAREYLANRHGDLWYELLAQAATGRVDYPQLVAAASTGARRAELAFYAAVLGLDPSIRTRAAARTRLRASVEAGLVMDAEYDLARQYLAMP